MPRQFTIPLVLARWVRLYVFSAREHPSHRRWSIITGPVESGGIVDSTLCIHGIEGLRVCDASVFPDIVSGYPVRRLVVVLRVNGDANLSVAERCCHCGGGTSSGYDQGFHPPRLLQGLTLTFKLDINPFGDCPSPL
jgi:hypothetical protein